MNKTYCARCEYCNLRTMRCENINSLGHGMGGSCGTYKMKTLEEFNKERTILYDDLNSGRPRKNGITCPKCNKELYDSSPMYVYASLPPKLDVHCECGYTGYRIK